MFYVATLIAPPGGGAITPTLLREIAGFLPCGRIEPWLDPGVALDISFEMEDFDDPNVSPDGEQALLTSLGDDILDTIGSAPVDVIVQPDDAHRRKRLFLADMDSTMIGQECIDQLADFVGLKAEVSAITERAMRGEIAFEPALIERVALLRGLTVAVVERIVAERISLTPGGLTLVRTMKANGVYACLVSGGFTLFTGPIAQTIGFDEHRANRLVVTEDKLAGFVEEPILGREAKLAALIDLRRRFGLARQDTLAVGDGANDLAMLQEAGLGVAFRAKPAVAAAADARIEHGDLTALLYAQGYRRDEFVA